MTHYYKIICFSSVKNFYWFHLDVDGSIKLTIEGSSADGIGIGIAKSRLLEVSVGELDSLHILLLLYKHASVLKELVQRHFGLLEGWRSLPGVHKLLPDRIHPNF